MRAGDAPDMAPYPFDPRFWGGTMMTSDSGQLVNATTALQLDVVASVLERLSGSISTLPLMVFERTGESTRRVARDHPLFKVLHERPNQLHRVPAERTLMVLEPLKLACSHTCVQRTGKKSES